MSQIKERKIAYGYNYIIVKRNKFGKLFTYNKEGSIFKFNDTGGVFLFSKQEIQDTKISKGAFVIKLNLKKNKKLYNIMKTILLSKNAIFFIENVQKQ